MRDFLIKTADKTAKSEKHAKYEKLPENTLGLIPITTAITTETNWFLYITPVNKMVKIASDYNVKTPKSLIMPNSTKKAKTAMQT